MVTEKIYALRSKYSPEFWHGLPQDMGGWFHSTEVEEHDRIAGTIEELEIINKITHAFKHFDLIEIGTTGKEIILNA